MTRKALVLLSLLLALSIESKATVSFIIQADLLTDQNGVAIPNNSLVLLIASTGDSIFSPLIEGDSTQQGTALKQGGDDYVVFRTQINTGSGFGPGVLDSSTPGLNLASIPGWNPGDPLALVWFPTLNSSTSLLSAGSRYGIYSNPLAVDGSRAWFTPNDPTTNAFLLFFTKNGQELSPGPTASNDAVVGRANATVAPVPEPGSAVFVGLGMAALIARRRRK